MKRVIEKSLVALGTLIVAAPAFAINNGTAPEADDTRFDAVGALSFEHWLGQDPDGNNAWDHNWYCTAVLISENIVLTARHCVTNPEVTDYVVRFRRQTDGSLGTTEDGVDSFFHATVAEWQNVPGFLDMKIGVLTDSVTHIEPIPTITRGQHQLRFTPVILGGWGKEGPGTDEGPKRELLICDHSASSVTVDKITWDNNEEYCSVNIGDSGSPVLLEGNNGELRVAGIVYSTGVANSFQILDSYTSLPIPHTPFTGSDLAMETQNVDRVVAPGKDVIVGFKVGDVGADPVKDAVLTLSVTQGSTVFASQKYRVTQLQDWYERKFSFPVPSTVPDGRYSLRVQLDPADQREELFETNNFSGLSNFFSVTSASHDIERLRWAYIMDSAGLAGFFLVAERTDDTVAIVGGLNDSLYSYGATATKIGDSVRLGTATFTLEENGDEVELVSETEGYTAYMNGSYSPQTGPVGHLQGVYSAAFRGKQSTSMTAIVSADNGVMIGGIPGAFIKGGLSPATGTFHGENGESGAIVWDSRQSTYRFDLSVGRKVISMYLRNQ